MNKPLVTVIILNWNGINFLKDCLDSLVQVKYKNLEIIFADNASTDGSVKFVKKNYPRMKILENKENLGYAQGHEEAFRKAKGKFVMLLSTDTIVEKNLLNELVSAINKEKNIGAVMPKLIMYPKKHLIDSIGVFFIMNGDLYHYGREKNPNLALYNKKMEIFSAKGACLLFRKETLDKTGLFDKDYFAYFEETDLCMRVWLSGYKVLYIPTASVYHRGGETSKKISSSYIQFHSYKNRLCSYMKNFSFKYLIKIMPSTIFIYEIAALLYIVKGRFDISLAIQKSIWWNILNIKATLKKRKFIQNNIRKIKDESFMPRLTKKVKLIYYYYQFFGGLNKYKD